VRRIRSRRIRAETLDAVPGIENPSDTKRHVGTRGVAEPAALLCAGVQALLLPKQSIRSRTPDAR
jgi:cobalt-precorrin 5A hydrolase